MLKVRVGHTEQITSLLHGTETNKETKTHITWLKSLDYGKKPDYTEKNYSHAGRTSKLYTECREAAVLTTKPVSDDVTCKEILPQYLPNISHNNI